MPEHRRDRFVAAPAGDDRLINGRLYEKLVID
jgi:hypothetical protein